MSVNIVLNINSSGFIDHVSYMQNKKMAEDRFINPDEAQQCKFQCGQCKMRFIVRIAFKFPYESSTVRGKTLKLSHVQKMQGMFLKKVNSLGKKPQVEMQKALIRKSEVPPDVQDNSLTLFAKVILEDEKLQIQVKTPDEINAHLPVKSSESAPNEENDDDDEFIDETFPSDDEMKVETLEEFENIVEDNRRPWWDPLLQKENRLYSECQICGLTNLNQRSKSQHMKLLHPDHGKRVCDVCGQLYTAARLFGHRERHFPNSTAVHPCDRCHATYNYIRDLEDHRRKCERIYVRKRERNFPCTLCGIKFQSQKGLDQHTTRMHPDGRATIYKCQDCPYTATIQKRLVSHIECIHADHRPFVCDLCSKTFANKTAILCHMKCTHCDTRPYVCEICGAAYKQSSTLRCHKYTHTGHMPYSCNLCDKKFTNPSKRAEHRKRVHDKIKTVKKKRKVSA